MANLVTTTNALTSIRTGKVGAREQTILTPETILGPLRSIWGRIGFDPVHVPGALTNPEVLISVDWSEVWDTAESFAEFEGFDLDSVRVLRGEIQAGKVSTLAAKQAQELRSALRRAFRGREGLSVRWLDRTFVNPPYGNLGPECLFGGFEDFVRKFAESDSEIALLGPVRTHRKWYREHIRSADRIVYLDPIQFEGYSQTFPAPLSIAYKGPRADAIEEAFSGIGCSI